LTWKAPFYKATKDTKELDGGGGIKGGGGGEKTWGESQKDPSHLHSNRCRRGRRRSPRIVKFARIQWSDAKGAKEREWKNGGWNTLLGWDYQFDEKNKGRHIFIRATWDLHEKKNQPSPTSFPLAKELSRPNKEAKSRAIGYQKRKSHDATNRIRTAHLDAAKNKPGKKKDRNTSDSKEKKKTQSINLPT